MASYIGQVVLYQTQDGDAVEPQAAVVVTVQDSGSLNLFVPIFGRVVTDVEHGATAGTWTDLVVPTAPTA